MVARARCPTRVARSKSLGPLSARCGLQHADRDHHGLDLQQEAPLGKFILGFIVAIVIVLFVVARCVGAIV
jgi:hypothetical protein